jgi:ABC-type arginine transport system ATPase subunit
MKLQQVKIFRPDARGKLKLVKVISQAEVTKLAELNITKSKFNWKKKREIKRNENK